MLLQVFKQTRLWWVCWHLWTSVVACTDTLAGLPSDLGLFVFAFLIFVLQERSSLSVDL